MPEERAGRGVPMWDEERYDQESRRLSGENSRGSYDAALAWRPYFEEVFEETFDTPEELAEMVIRAMEKQQAFCKERGIAGVASLDDGVYSDAFGMRYREVAHIYDGMYIVGGHHFEAVQKTGGWKNPIEMERARWKRLQERV